MEASIFLTIEEVHQIHEDQISRYGGSAGVRDERLLESAISTPTATFGGAFLNADLFEMAAAYLVSIVMNHPFIDGNKRTGTTAALTFLQVNGVTIRNLEPDFSNLVIGVTEGKVEKAEVAEFLRRNSST